MIDKNGTSYLTTTGKEKQTTLGILGVYNCHYIIVLFFKSSKLQHQRVFKCKPISKFHNKAKKASFLGAFASCLHNLDCCQ